MVCFFPANDLKTSPRALEDRALLESILSSGLVSIDFMSVARRLCQSSLNVPRELAVLQKEETPKGSRGSCTSTDFHS